MSVEKVMSPPLVMKTDARVDVVERRMLEFDLGGCVGGWAVHVEDRQTH